MKKIKMAMVMVMAVIGIVCALGKAALGAGGTYPLSQQEQAAYGATHVTKFTYADFTEVTTNSAQTNTTLFTVAAKQGVYAVAMVLKTPFNCSATYGTNLTVLTLKVGDGTDDDLYFTSTELSENGTEVLLKFPPEMTGTCVGTANTNTGLMTATNTLTAYGHKLYTSADTIDLIFTPTCTLYSLDEVDSGEVNIYWRLFDAR